MSSNQSSEPQSEDTTVLVNPVAQSLAVFPLDKRRDMLAAACDDNDELYPMCLFLSQAPSSFPLLTNDAFLYMFYPPDDDIDGDAPDPFTEPDDQTLAARPNEEELRQRLQKTIDNCRHSTGTQDQRTRAVATCAFALAGFTSRDVIFTFNDVLIDTDKAALENALAAQLRIKWA